jgi:DNA-binding IclR family transcriptional regulator
MIRIANDTVAPSQTLDRGLACLDLVAAADHALSVDAAAEALGLHRSIVYRLMRTLELRRLIERDPGGDFLPGPYLAVLSRSVRRSLRAAAAPVVATLAEDLQMTAFVVVADGDEAVTIDSVEPRSLNAHVAYRPGTRHPLDRGAPGLALLAARPALVDERAQIAIARVRGWAHSEAEVIPGMASVASPIGDEWALAVLWLAGTDVSADAVGPRVAEAAHRIESRLD